MKFTRTVCLVATLVVGTAAFAAPVLASSPDAHNLARDLRAALTQKFKTIAPTFVMKTVTCVVTKTTGSKLGGATVSGTIKGKCSARFAIKGSSEIVTYPVTATDTLKARNGGGTNSVAVSAGVKYATGHPSCTVGGKKVAC
jgi:hypothetical protein